MERRTVSLGLLIAALGAVALRGQEVPGKLAPRPTPGAQPAQPARLEEMLEQALQGSPEVKLAEANLRKAQEELELARVQVAQKVIAHRHAWEAQKVAIDDAKDRLEHRMEKLSNITKRFNTGTAGSEEKLEAELAVKEAERALVLARAKLAEIEALAPYLVGKARVGASSAGGRVPQEALWKLREALKQPVNLQQVKDARIVNILQDLHRQVPSVSFQVTAKLSPRGINLDSSLESVPLRVALQVIEDVLTGLRFVAREYGFLATESPPEGAVLLRDLEIGN